jgi:hypothetical protein
MSTTTATILSFITTAPAALHKIIASSVAINRVQFPDARDDLDAALAAYRERTAFERAEVEKKVDRAWEEMIQKDITRLRLRAQLKRQKKLLAARARQRELTPRFRRARQRTPRPAPVRARGSRRLCRASGPPGNGGALQAGGPEGARGDESDSSRHGSAGSQSRQRTRVCRVCHQSDGLCLSTAVITLCNYVPSGETALNSNRWVHRPEGVCL